MNEISPNAPELIWFWRIVRFPLIRVVVMGAVYVLLIGCEQRLPGSTRVFALAGFGRSGRYGGSGFGNLPMFCPFP